MIRKIKIKKEMLDEIKKHVLESKPFEVCGLIIGTIRNETAISEKVIRIKNVKSSSVEFLMDPNELYKAYMLAEKLGKEVVGVYHSHPSGNNPSLHDLTNMELNPYVWVIIDMNTLSHKAFFLAEDKSLYEVEIIII